jgi:hypothetical protein
VLAPVPGSSTLFEHLWPVVAIDLAAILAGTPGVPADNHTAGPSMADYLADGRLPAQDLAC